MVEMSGDGGVVCVKGVMDVLLEVDIGVGEGGELRKGGFVNGGMDV